MLIHSSSTGNAIKRILTGVLPGCKIHPNISTSLSFSLSLPNGFQISKTRQKRINVTLLIWKTSRKLQNVHIHHKQVKLAVDGQVWPKISKTSHWSPTCLLAVFPEGQNTSFSHQIAFWRLPTSANFSNGPKRPNSSKLPTVRQNIWLKVKLFLLVENAFPAS